jgi:hypothetical protein
VFDPGTSLFNTPKLVDSAVVGNLKCQPKYQIAFSDNDVAAGGQPGDSAMIENILPLDFEIAVPAGGPVTFKGPPDYAPVDKDLSPGTTVELAHYIMENDLHEDAFHTQILNGVDPYNFRSTATTGVVIGLDLQSPYVPLDELRKAITEMKMLRPYWLGDYYALTPINIEQNTWCGWQFNRPDLNAGFAMFFRVQKAFRPVMKPDCKVSISSRRMKSVSPKHMTSVPAA